MSDKNAIALVKRDTVDIVAEKVKQFQKTGELHFPKNYSPENAMKSAWLKLQCIKTSKKDGERPVLEACSKDSIANSLLEMVVQGLTPAKNQGYFMPYGNQLIFQRSYFGTMAVTKRLNEVKDIRSQIIYEDDVFELKIENGEKRVEKHIQKLENIDLDKITGAYCIIERNNGTLYTEVMNINQIKQAWKQSRTSYSIFDDKGNVKANSVHGKFTDQMVLKTVINRACKVFANTSDDSDLLIEHFNKTTENEYKQEQITAEEEVKQEIEDKANKENLNFEDDDVIDVTAPTENTESPDF